MFNKINECIILIVGDLFIDNVNENNSYYILVKVKKLINEGVLSKIFNIKEVFLFVNLS